jgi:hypothetical protein
VGSERSGRRTADFRGRKSPDRSKQDAKNRALGLAGELAVVAHEQFTTIRPPDDGMTGREIGASFSSARCVRDCI